MKTRRLLAYVAFLGGHLLAQSPLTITTDTLPDAIYHQPYSFQLTAAGGTPPYSWSQGGLQTAGLSMNSNGLIFGTPSWFVVTGVHLNLTDAAGAKAFKTLRLRVTGPVEFNSTYLPPGVLGIPYLSWVSARGGVFGFTYSVISGTPPSGIAFESTGMVHGTPTQAGNWVFTVQARDAAGAIVNQPFTILITDPNAPLAFHIAPEVRLKVGTSANITGTVTGIAPPFVIWLESGSLPEGMTWHPDPFRITGTPVRGGTYQLVFGVGDRPGFRKAFGTTKLIIAGNVTVSGGVLPAAKHNNSYSHTLTASGGATPYTWSIIEGTLPAGLSLSASGEISGIATSPSGAYRFRARAVDAGGAVATGNFTLDVHRPAIATTSVPAAELNVPYSFSLAGRGGSPPYKWSISSGSLPAGLSISPEGTLSGAATAAGTFPFTAMVTDSLGSFGTVSLSLSVIRPAPSFSGNQVVNAASFARGIAPGSLFTIMGANLSTGSEAADRFSLPTALAGTSVQVNGTAAPILAVSPEQINAQFPFSFSDTTAEIIVIANGLTSAKVSVPVTPAAPGLFQSAVDRLLAINENGTINDASNRARPGSIIVLYATGCGALQFGVREGHATPVDKLYPTRLPATVTMGGKPAQVLFAGAAPSLSSGLVQINVMVPELAAGDWPVVLTVDGRPSNSPKLYVAAR